VRREDRFSGEQPRKVEIFFEVPPSPQGTYLYERNNGTVIHGDASGEWILDENGELEDTVFFASPRSMGYGRNDEGPVRRDPRTQGPED